MIRLPANIYVATAPINLHFSFDRLAGIVREQFGEDPRGDALFVFHNKARTHLKMLWHSRRGYCVFYTRLDRGTYRIPMSIPEGAARVSVRPRELAVILRGLDRGLLREARISAAP